MLLVATPVLANYLFPGVIDGQLASHITQAFLGMHLKCLCLVPSPISQWRIDLENVKCSFYAKLCKWHIYIILSSLSPLFC